MTFNQQRRLIAIAGHRADEPTARAGLTDPDPDVRVAALAALDRMSRLDKADIDAALGDPSGAVRRRVCEIAARYESIDLVGHLRDEDSSVVEVAAWAIGEREASSPSIVQALASIASRHGDALCRESAVAALGALGDTKGLDTILAALKEKAPIRRRAILALAPFDGDRVRDALSAALDDRDWQVRQAAKDMLS